MNWAIELVPAIQIVQGNYRIKNMYEFHFDFLYDKKQYKFFYNSPLAQVFVTWSTQLLTNGNSTHAPYSLL